LEAYRDIGKVEKDKMGAKKDKIEDTYLFVYSSG
jgi:hypothetical protein